MSDPAEEWARFCVRQLTLVRAALLNEQIVLEKCAKGDAALRPLLAEVTASVKHATALKEFYQEALQAMEEEPA